MSLLESPHRWILQSTMRPRQMLRRCPSVLRLEFAGSATVTEERT